MKCVLRVRYLIFLALLYLVLVSLLYHYLWQAKTLDDLLESHGGTGKLHAKYTNLINYDYPSDSNDVVEDPGKVEFNFKRNPAPQGVKVFNGQIQRPSPNSSHEEFHTQNSIPIPVNSSTTDLSLLTSTIKTLTQTDHASTQTNTLPSFPRLNHCLHAFYYAWYGNEETDGHYMHWNHHYMPHWKESITRKYPKGRHVPPDDIGASFYPELGCYSSKDPMVISKHMLQLGSAGIGVIVVSWYPAGLSDDEGPPPDPIIPLLLDAALEHGIKITLHIEPYKGRTPQSVADDLKYIHLHYTQHLSFYKLEHVNHSNGVKSLLPLIYIYDSYLSEVSEWARVLKHGGPHSVRGKDYDCIAIALLVERTHMQFAVDGGFDGVYTYFAADGFSFGSTFTNWDTISKFVTKNNLIFIPSFGPGYNDLQVRPWNKVTTRDRRNGSYYQEGFKNGVKYTRSGILSITSFNEWGEGTQIESAVPKEGSRVYLDYTPRGGDFYLQLTREMSEQLLMIVA